MSSAGSAQRYETVNCELLTLTFGAIISQLLKDFEDSVKKGGAKHPPTESPRTIYRHTA